MTKDFAPPSSTKARNGRTTSSPKGKAGTKRNTGKKTGTPKARANSSTEPPPNKWKLVSILVLLAAGFGFGIYSLQKLPKTETTLPGETQPKQKQITSNENTEPVEAPEERFKFYNIFPESEVIPPKVDTYTFKEKGAQKDFHYIVQTGSFRTMQDAERQKATIAFQGLKAKITPSTNAKGITWYRVSTGPFVTRTKMNSALDKLVNIGIEPLVRKVDVD